MVSLRVAGATDTGAVRSHNEDNFLAQYPVFIVADGMGGHSAGEVASAIVVEEFRALISAGDLTQPMITAAIERANSTIFKSAAAIPERSGMGTTLVGLVMILESGLPYWMAFNIGDSRLYRMTSESLSLVTRDHSRVQEMVDSGEISLAEARTSNERNVITRAMGVEPSIIADIWLLSPRQGDRFLICSDGLTTELENHDIEEILRNNSDADTACRKLIEAATKEGGRDNITTIVIDVESEFEISDGDTLPKHIISSN
ncbi:MAG: Stp1/IreP family PP2C-type Ser/Thr phosphatase [Acidimicrobiales bacterium]|nr:Stp1/IreP family PP2C-type Ser/Thr phosphatase [Acidimicrobiales bacterium]